MRYRSMPAKNILAPSGLLHKCIQGQQFPTLGLGTFGLYGASCRKAVCYALGVGYRHIDTARIYENEGAVGLGIWDSGLERSDLFITSKVWWQDLAPAKIRSEVDASLEELQTDYLDLALIHWPNPEFSIQQAIETLAERKALGKIRFYGVSNFTPSLFNEAVGYGEIFCNQVEYHPLLDQSRLLDRVRSHDSALIAYCPLAQGTLAGESELAVIGQKYGKSCEQVALRWLIEQDNVVAIPRSSNPKHLESNYNIFDFELDASDRERIASLPKDRRQIDPYFAQDWET